MEWDLFSLYSVKQENGHSCLPKEAESASVDKHQNFLYSYIASKRNCNIHKSLEYLIFVLLHLFSTCFVIFERLVFSLCLRLVATAKKTNPCQDCFFDNIVLEKEKWFAFEYLNKSALKGIKLCV